VGKNTDTVQIWIKKILQPNPSVDQPTASVADRVVNSIREKAGSKDSRHPANYTLEETLAIVQAGGNETLAARKPRTG
jgi:hypothetical protein